MTDIKSVLKIQLVGRGKDERVQWDIFTDQLNHFTLNTARVKKHGTANVSKAVEAQTLMFYCISLTQKY